MAWIKRLFRSDKMTAIAAGMNAAHINLFTF